MNTFNLWLLESHDLLIAEANFSESTVSMAARFGVSIEKESLELFQDQDQTHS